MLQKTASWTAIPRSCNSLRPTRCGTVQVGRFDRVAHFLMPEQQESKPPAPSTPAPDNQGSRLRQTTPMQPTQTDLNPPPQRIPNWLRQSEHFLRVIVRMYIGVLVCFAPWYPSAWDNNPLFTASPWLSSFISHGAIRGVVSGLGLLNLYIALRDAIPSTKDDDSM